MHCCLSFYALMRFLVEVQSYLLSNNFLMIASNLYMSKSIMLICFAVLWGLLKVLIVELFPLSSHAFCLFLCHKLKNFMAQVFKFWSLSNFFECKGYLLKYFFWRFGFMFSIQRRFIPALSSRQNVSDLCDGWRLWLICAHVVATFCVQPTYKFSCVHVCFWSI